MSGKHIAHHPPIFKVAVAISAINEELHIGQTIAKLLKIFPPKDIYVVNDASRDYTASRARKFGVHVYNNRQNLGKTLSLAKAVKQGQLISRYQAVLFMDADTEIDPDFLRQALPHLRRPEIAAIAGRVKTKLVDNPFVVYRAYYYAIWQQFWKRLSDPVNGVIVAPGTAAIYKTSLLQHLQFDPQIVIEDFDLTFQTHRLISGRVRYVPKAIVYTQDPNNLYDYHRQLVRWNLGLFQTMVKHRVPLKLQSFELLVVYFLLQNVLHILVLFSLPVYVFSLSVIAFYNLFSLTPVYEWEIYLTQYALVDFGLLTILTVLYFSKHRYWRALKYLPVFWTIQYVNASAFLVAVYKLFTAPRTSVWVPPKRW